MRLYRKKDFIRVYFEAILGLNKISRVVSSRRETQIKEDGITAYFKVSILVLLLCSVEIFRVIEGNTVSIDIKI